MLVEVQSLSVSFGPPARPLRAVRAVDLAITRGTIHGLIGESGCGKTMTGMAFLGLLPPGARMAAQRFRFDGADLDQAAAAGLRGERISLISQDPAAALNPVLSIARQIDDVLARHGTQTRAERRARALELLADTGLEDPARVLQSHPHQLSGGMQQRVVIAQALATGADFLIADEPTTALDKTVGRQVLAVLRRLVATRGLTVLMITHDMEVVAEACDRASVLYAGITVEEGPTEALLRHPRHPYTRALLAALPGQVPKGKRLEAIEGHPPPPLDQIAGCAFATRCRAALPACASAPPPARAQAGQSWACHLGGADG